MFHRRTQQVPQGGPRGAQPPATSRPVRRISIFLLLTLLLLALAGALTFWAAHKRTQSIALTRHTYEVLLAFQGAETDLIDRVASLRLYLETPSEAVLQSTLLPQRGFEAHLAQAQAVTSDDPGQQKRLARIQDLARRWEESANLVTQEVRRNRVKGMQAALRTLDQRSELVESARGEFAAGIRESLLQLHMREVADSQIQFWLTLAAGAVLMIGLVVAGTVLTMVLHLEASARALGAEMLQRKKAEARAQDLVELGPHPIVIADNVGRMVQVNAEAVRAFGYSREEMIGQPVELLLPERFREAHPALRAGYMNAPTIRPMGTGRDLFGRRKDGSEFPVDISLGPIQAEDGLEVIASIVDITERARAQEALREANRAYELVNRELDSFAYSVAHDLRAPLRSMTGFAQLLLGRHQEGLSGEAQNYLARIREAGNRMAQLIDDLLTLSRITRGSLQREAVDVTGIARAVLQELRTAAPERDVQVTVAEGLSDSADPRLLRVLLDNLLGNAWKFTSRVPQARIEFGALSEGTRCTYFVRDNGAGFNMAYVNKLFRAFERLHDEREFAGTGVGLATALRIVSRHGGRIWAEGTEGQGAVFYFTL